MCFAIDSGIVTGEALSLANFFPVSSNSLRSLCHSFLGLVSLIPSRLANTCRPPYYTSLCLSNLRQLMNTKRAMSLKFRHVYVPKCG